VAGRICTAGPTQWRNYRYQLTAAETSVPSAPYRLDTPLSFVSRRPSVWYAGHGHREATSDRLIASAERLVTIIPLTIGLLSGSRVSLDSRKSRNSFSGIEKKNRDSRLNIPIYIKYFFTRKCHTQLLGLCKVHRWLGQKWHFQCIHG